MPEYIRALIIILALSTGFFMITKRPVCNVIKRSDFVRIRNLWFSIVITAFLAHNVYLFVFIVALLVIFVKKYQKNNLALYFAILFAVPVAYLVVPGFGLINYFIDLSYQRELVILIFLPLFLKAQQTNDRTSGIISSDVWLICYILLASALELRSTTVTDTLRTGFYFFIDVFIPYYVISRLLVNTIEFKETLLWLIISIMITALIGIFEALRHWLLYASMLNVLDIGKGMTTYLPRDGMIRAISTAGQPIALGYLIMVGIGLYLFIQHYIKLKIPRRSGILLLTIGIIAPLSRGPWVGAVVILVVFLVTGKSAIKKLMILALAGTLALLVLSVLPVGNKLVNLLPFVGKTATKTVTYRDELIHNSIIVIKRNFWLGSVNYLEEPEMRELNKTGGKIDVVNTYIGIALEYGLLGLGLFVAFFLSIVFGLYWAIQILPDKESEEHLLGRALLATLIGILVTIMTVSSITIIPIVYWSIAGISVAYIQMVKRRIQSTSPEPA